MVESASLLASVEQTPQLIAKYQQQSKQEMLSLEHGRYLRSEHFAPQALILVTSRCNGHSVAPYASFNLAHHVGDNLEVVQSHRQQLYQDLGCRHLCFMEQTHSNKICIVGSKIDDVDKAAKESGALAMSLQEPIVSGIDCDGLVTAEQGVALAVMTADCLPLLLCDPQAKVVAAVHCGWKGIERQIIKNALQAMLALGAKLPLISAFLGPAIGPQSFEVGAEVREAFVALNPDYAQAFIAEQRLNEQQELEICEGKFLCDLYELCRMELSNHGVSAQNIKGGEFDTRLQTELFYSYRQEKVTGRMASVVCLS